MAQPLVTVNSSGEVISADAHLVERRCDLANYPERLFAPEMADIFRVSLKRFYLLSREGAFDFALIKPRVGKLSWSRERVREHLHCQLNGLTASRKAR